MLLFGLSLTAQAEEAGSAAADWSRLPSPWETLQAHESFRPTDDMSVLAPDLVLTPPDPRFAAASPPHAQHVKPFKQGFFQRLTLEHTWVTRPDSTDFGLHQTRAGVTVALPLPRPEWPLLISTGYSSYWFDGPIGVDVPATLFDAGVRFLWLPQWGPRWRGIFGIHPGVYSDMDHVRSDSLRIKGFALSQYEWKPDVLKVAAGVVFLDRDDISLVPAVGLTWTPSPDHLVEVTLPRPRVAQRLYWDGRREDWVYAAAELGGETWTIRPSPNVARKMTLREYRLLVGWESQWDGGRGFRWEAGYVIGRQLRLTDPLQVVHGDPAILLRASVTW